MNNKFDFVWNKIKLIDKKLSRRDWSPKISERELTYLFTKIQEIALATLLLHQKGEKNSRYVKVWFLSCDTLVNSEAKKAIFGSFPRNLSNQNKIISEH